MRAKKTKGKAAEQKTKLSVLLFKHNLQLTALSDESHVSYKVLCDMKKGNRDNFNESSYQAVADAIVRLRPGAGPLAISDVKGYDTQEVKDGKAQKGRK